MLSVCWGGVSVTVGNEWAGQPQGPLNKSPAPPGAPGGLAAGETLREPSYTASVGQGVFRSLIEKVTSHLESGAVPGCRNSQAKFLLCRGQPLGWKLHRGRGGGRPHEMKGQGGAGTGGGEQGRSPAYLRESWRPPERPPRSPAETCGRSQEAACTEAPETQRFSAKFPVSWRALLCSDTALLY